VTADSADRPTALVDGSVALPALSEQHEFHDVAFAAVSEHRVGIAAHALFETYAVLTRHPSLRVTPAQALAFSTALSSTGLRSAQRRPIAPSKRWPPVRSAASRPTTASSPRPRWRLAYPCLLSTAGRVAYEAMGADVHYLG
jgi:hypothetical protein